MDKYEVEAIKKRETDLLIARLDEMWEVGRKQVVSAIQKAMGAVEIQYPYSHDIKVISAADKQRGYDNYWMFKLDKDGMETGNRDFSLSKLIALNDAFCRYEALLDRIRLEDELTDIRIKHLTEKNLVEDQ